MAPITVDLFDEVIKTIIQWSADRKWDSKDKDKKLEHFLELLAGQLPAYGTGYG